METFGGAESGGGIPLPTDEGRVSLAGGGGAAYAADLWFQNLELANNIFGIVALLKVAGISYLWFIYYD